MRLIGVVGLAGLAWLACSSSPSDPPHDAGARADAGSARDAAGQPCMVNADCTTSDLLLFCQRDDCDTNTPGVCTPRPGTAETGPCTTETSLVCGCNGQTYQNSCFAHGYGTNVATIGSCPLTHGGPCTTDADCTEPLQYCKKAQCSDGRGTCEGTPATLYCISVRTPTCVGDDAGGVSCSTDQVCGCDQRTYVDACQAAAYGVNVASSGACPTPPDAGP
jgi:hypothetical protein